MNKPVILLASGGHARVLLSMLRRLSVEIIGVTDPQRQPGSDWLGCRVLGDDVAVAGFAADQVELVNGVGSIPRDCGLRARLFAQFTALGYRFASVVDPSALLADDVVLAQGVQVMAGAIIQAGSDIAENSIVNSGTIVEHDCRVGRDSHIAPGAILCGGVELGDAVHVGAGALVIQGISIGSGSIIGAGSVVTRNIDSRQIVYPARPQIQDL